VRIVGMPIVREPDGLAMSSRNAYLTPEQRTAATVLRRALAAAEGAFADGVRDGAQIRRRVEGVIAEEPLAEVDYVSVADAETLEELQAFDAPALVSLAARFGQTRLIDNVVLTP